MEEIMKMNFDIECTPEEAREFLGLPPVAKIQERMMNELEERLAENIRSMEPENLMKTWLPTTMQNWSDMQKIFWDQMGQMGSGMQSASAGNAESDESSGATTKRAKKA